MLVPLSGIFEDHWIDFRGDKYADPQANDPAFAQPLRVAKCYPRWPNTSDLMAAFAVKLFGERVSADEEDLGMTLIVTLTDGASANLLYFPNDQHEVRVADIDDDDDDNAADHT